MPFFIRLWNRFSKTQQRLVLIVGGTVLLLAVDAVSLRPLRARLGALRQEVHATEQRLIDALIARAQVEAVNEAFAAYYPYLRTADTGELELSAVLTEVETAVREAGMILLNLKPVTGLEGGSVTIQVRLEGEANPVQVVTLLHRLQRSRRLLRVTELNLRATDDGVLRSTLVVSKLAVAELAGS